MSGITFGTPAAANTSTGFSLGGGFGNASTGGGFAFGGLGASSAGAAVTTTTASLGIGFSFGGASQPTAASSAAPLGFGGLGGSALSASGTNTLFGNQTGSTFTSNAGCFGGMGPKATSQATTLTPLRGGLGGSDGSKSPAKSGLGNKTNEVKGIKDNVVPPEILATVEEFSKHVKAQKLVRESIARMTSRPLFKVEDDLKESRQRLHEVATMLHNNSVAVEKLKKEATQELKHVETAQRTKETPLGLQYENVQPTEYFQRLVEDFEHQMALYRQQFFDAEKFFASVNQASASDPSELLKVFTKLNEGFISLAAKLQVVHESVKNLKENYAQFRKKHVCEEDSNVFRRNGRPFVPGVAKDFTTFGPSPFSFGSSASSVALSSAVEGCSSRRNKTDSIDVSCRVGPFQQQIQRQPQLEVSTAFDSATFGSSNQINSSVAMGTTLQRPGNKRGKNA